LPSFAANHDSGLCSIIYLLSKEVGLLTLLQPLNLLKEQIGLSF